MLLVTWHLLIGCSFSFTIYFIPTLLVAQSCPTLCDPIDCSPPGSSVHGILQARILEGVATPSSRGSSRPRDPALVSCISRFGRCFLVALALPGKPVLGAGATADQFSSVAQSCLTLSDPMDRSPPGSSVHGLFQARVLEWGAIAFSGVTRLQASNFNYH